MTLGLILAIACRGQPTESSSTASPPMRADAIVVGAGIAGLSAAWELAQGGAKVVVVDMASVFGGHAVMATGDLCLIGTPEQEAKGIRDTPEIAYKDFVAWGEDPNPEWTRYYVSNTGREIRDWLIAKGVEFEALIPNPGNSVLRTHRTKGRGLGLVSPIFRECVSHPNISFVWNTRVDRLLIIRSGQRIDGIAGTNVRTGVALELRARSVVLATGGFQSNLDMVRETWPSGLTFPRNFLIGSGINSVGSGLKIVEAAGAAVSRLDHQWNYISGLPDPRHPGENRGLVAYNNDSMWLNAEGRRFITERTSSKFSFRILLAQPGQTYWSIFDETAKRNFWVAGSSWIDFREVERLLLSNPAVARTATTIDELALKTGLPAEAVKRSVQRFNEMVERGVDEDFGRFGPGKPHQPKKIATPPFYAVQHFPITRKSMGGVVIDTSCRVQDTDQRTIPGLYAAGEVTGLAGINGKAGLEGTFLGPSIVTGRVAGRTVLEDLGRKPASGKVSPRPIDPPVKPDPPASTSLCLTCHDLPKLIAQPRPGYWHFEKVHREVVATKRDCTQCHAELTPTFDPHKHRINRLAQVQNCATCHKGEDR